MKKIHLAVAIVLGALTVKAQHVATIKVADTKRIISYLAADEMRGRATFSPEIDKAADYIAAAFKKAGLQPLAGNSFLQAFSMVSVKQTALTASINNTPLPAEKVLVLTSATTLSATQNDGYTIERIAAGDNIFTEAIAFSKAKKNTLVLVDTSFSDKFKRLSALKRSMFKTDVNIIYILTTDEPTAFDIKATHEVKENKLQNVVGVLPGKKLKDEYVVFSAHYDHIGIDKKGGQDSIYNGANDDASGTTAVMQLADYFARQKNERSIVFAAFTAEEIGGFGSRYFSEQLDPDKTVAMFNIEMIGTDSKWGKNSAFITGYEKSNFGEILQKNLTKTKFRFYPDPYPDQQLFYRSDNATLAALGVPAHTISTSKMDNEPNYHKASDEVSTLDLNNMVEIIKSIALSAQTIIGGKDTPTRVEKQ